MNKYRWTCQIEVDADDDIEARERISEHLEEMYADPDTPISYGKLEKQIGQEEGLPGQAVKVGVWQEVK